jgi:hypothetical protein
MRGAAPVNHHPTGRTHVDQSQECAALACARARDESTARRPGHDLASVSMTAQLNRIVAQQRSTELQFAAEQTRLASELPRAGLRAARAQEQIQKLRATGFTLRGHHLAKLDRFLGKAQRAALRAGRDFEGVSIEITAQGVVVVHAIGMTSMLL